MPRCWPATTISRPCLSSASSFARWTATGSVGDTIPSAELVKRHAGVLGLGACVLSSPYDVPTWMPQLLMNLSAHLNDPQPIEMTVKKTLSNFRRTHHDNWQEHKQQFTDDQLLVLTDLLVAPCARAYAGA